MARATDNPAKIFIRSPNWVGDAVMATPAFRAIAKAHPQAELVVEGREYLRNQIEPLPYVSRFLADPGKGFGNLRKRVKALKAEGFDWAFLLPDSHSTGVGPWLARIPLRIGYARDFARRMMLTQSLKVPMEGPRKRLPFSMIDRYLAIPKALGIPDDGVQQDVPILDSARERVRQRMVDGGLDPDAPYMVIVPGASFGASKSWPVEHFAAASDAIYERYGLPTTIAPGPNEVDVAKGIVEKMKAPVLALIDPCAGIDGAAALIHGSRFVLSNDTGPRHFAVAFQIPVVVPIGPTDSRHTDHQLELQRVVRQPTDCAPCGLKVCPIDHRCMTQLMPETIVAAADELLALTA